MDEIRGLLKVSPTSAGACMIGTLAILGMPPFGVFASEFLILTTAMREYPWATPILLVALGVAFAAVFRASSRWSSAIRTSRDYPPAGAHARVHPPGAGAHARPLHSPLPRGAGTRRPRSLIG
jgi:formate hydrogenlyase subunit 3/multisubunit Na+/H+ antiporter MnhD subunit